MSCQTTRATLIQAWPQVTGLPAMTLAALQMVQAIAAGEGVASGCWPQCSGVCNNWGAIQQSGSPVTHDGSTPNCPAGSAPCVDTSPTASGAVKYGVCFKTYASSLAGATDYLKVLVLRSRDTKSAVGSGNADEMARAMYMSHYFQGNSTDPPTAWGNYAQGIATRAKSIASCMGEAVLVTRGDATPLPFPVVVLAIGGALTLGYGLWSEYGTPKKRRARR